MIHLVGHLANIIGFNDLKFEIADAELVRVSKLANELQDKINELEADFENQISDFRSDVNCKINHFSFKENQFNCEIAKLTRSIDGFNKSKNPG